MSAYGALAGSYDRLTSDVDYDGILTYLDSLLQKEKKAPQTVLDLCCGTGSMAVRMAQRGWQVTGVDASEEMLTMATDKAAGLPDDLRPFFACQLAQKLRLPAPVDLAICCLDSLNYLTKPADCEMAVRRVYQALKPGGLFVFDLNTPEKLRAMDDQVFLDEDDDVYCVWRGSFDAKTKICTYGMDLFQRDGNIWRRSLEEHEEYAYTIGQMTQYLAQAGFTGIKVYGDRSLKIPQAGQQRIYFTALKE
ncbi:MAG: class I SAM-dependent methyltransferase [Oscillospiraceae bacterium]|nr:class I SAM-dependent methyltransferase [Oscillospiraceae bacterium]